MKPKPHFRHILFQPQTLAFIGASERGLYPAGIMQNLLDHGFGDHVFPVNPNRETVFGVQCYPSVKDLPKTPDLALLTVPRQAVNPVIQECISKGIPAAVVISAGFAESDQTGQVLQTELKALVQSSEIRLIGPNCAGLASLPNGFIATRLADPLIPGPVAFASQSGALMMSFQGLFADRGIGMSRLVSVGNQVDVQLAEMLHLLVDDPETEVITCFMEGLTDGRRLTGAFKHALEVGKPIILLKTGRTQRGMAAAATHTAALSGEDRVFQAICDQYGVILVDDIEPLLDITQIAAAFGKRFATQVRLGVITQSGGMGSLMADWIDRAGLNAPPLPESLKQKIYDLGTLPAHARLLNPADVRGASVTGEATGHTLSLFLEESRFDAVILQFARSTLTQRAQDTVESILRTAEGSEKPLMVIWSGQQNPPELETQIPAVNRLIRAGIPVFSQPGSLVRAVARLQGYWRYRAEYLNGFYVGAPE
jgi:acyl-CoA synthetase (NDP forming)